MASLQVEWQVEKNAIINGIVTATINFDNLKLTSSLKIIYLSKFLNSFSSIILTPNSLALSYLDPGLAPATT